MSRGEALAYEQIQFDTSDRIATITLDRPEVPNAYQPAMGDELVDAFARARDDAEIRAVVLTGAGRAFCAGVDLKFMKEHAARIAQGEDLVPLGEEYFVKGFAQVTYWFDSSSCALSCICNLLFSAERVTTGSTSLSRM